MMHRSMTPEGHSTRDRHVFAGRALARAESHALPLALGVVLLAFFVALGSNRSLAHVGGPGDLTREQIVISDLIALSAGAAVIPAMLYVIWQILHEIREEGGLLASADTSRESREKKTLKLILILALAAGLISALVLTRPRSSPIQPPASSRPSATSTLPQRNTRAQKTVATLAPWVVGGVGTCLVLLVTAAWVVRRRRTDLPVYDLSVDELESPRRELHELIGNSIEEIEREPDPRRAVIRAYAGMESTLARHALGRRPFEAPGEYLSRAFATMRLSRHPGERLTELFERARFSEHAIGPTMKRESIAALSELSNELEAKPK
jgi:hypothetical protein